MAQPDSLLKLSLEAIGKYFCDLYIYVKECHKVRPFSSNVIPFSGNVIPIFYRNSVQKFIFTCRDFHRLLRENVPVTLANEVTNKLLSCIKKVIRRHYLKCEKYEEIVDLGRYELEEELIKCVIHPGVTRIAPEVDFLDCSDFPQNKLSYYTLEKLLVKNVSCLTNLKSLNVWYAYQYYGLTDIEFPPFLEEFSGSCKLLKKIATSCRFIKVLELYGAMDITSIAIILQMENLKKLNIARTLISREGKISLLKGLIEKGETSKLKFLTLSNCNNDILRILSALPSLKISLDLEYEQMYDLSSLNNVRGLKLDTTLRDLNKILRDVGRHLVYLSVRSFNNEYVNSTNAEDLFLIGQYCTSLRCLHFSCMVDRFLSLEHYMRHPPVFQTVTCLKLNAESDEVTCTKFYPSHCYLPHKDLLHFLISQCVNVKKLEISSCLFSLNKYEFICNVIQAECIKNVEEVCFINMCRSKDNSRDNEVVQKLIDHCPKLRIVGGIPNFNESYKHNCQKLKFFKNDFELVI